MLHLYPMPTSSGGPLSATLCESVKKVGRRADEGGFRPGTMEMSLFTSLPSMSHQIPKLIHKGSDLAGDIQMEARKPLPP